MPTLQIAPPTADAAMMQTYSYQEALDASTKYFDGDELAASVWINKYALKDSQGKIYEKTPDDMYRRIARVLADIEKNFPKPLKEEEIYQLLSNFKYIVPQGGPMAGIGNPFQVTSLSNCFVIGNGADSYGGIIRLDEEQAQLMKRRGGVGHDLSHLRPKGSPVHNSALTSTGIVPFMERYSNCTREVAQDGRRGALMLSLSVKHPDAVDFVDAKLDLQKVTGANISLRIDDDFMKSVTTKKPYVQQFPIDSDEPTVQKEVDAGVLWSKLVHNAWKSAEPGILFWDTVTRESVADCYADLGFKTVSTNPCGEIPLCPYDSCRLLAINLYSYVIDPFTDEARFDLKKFKKHVQLAQRIMDDIVELELYHIRTIINKISSDPEAKDIKRTELELWKKIYQKAEQGRRTGIGITAEGDMLAALGYTYGSDESIAFSTELHKMLAIHAYRGSALLAKERGSFPIYDAEREKTNPFIRRLFDVDPETKKIMMKYGRRNIALLTIAPTGTTSLMTQTSSGLEPVFMVSYKRRKKVNPNDQNVKVSFVDEVGDHWEEYNVLHHKFADWLQLKGYDLDEVKHMDTEALEQIIRLSPFYKATANSINWVQKVKLQGAVQKWVDHSISVTVNIPEESTEELVNEIFVTAWKSGCKGITIYRDGSRSGVLVSNEEKKSEELLKVNHSPKRPKRLEAEVIRFQNNKETWIAVVGLLEGRPYEIFTGRAEDTFILPKEIKKSWIIKVKDEKRHNRYDFQFLDKDGFRVTYEGLSRSFNKEYWNYAKLISGVLRHGMPIPFVVDLIGGLHLESDTINTWKTGVVRALKKFIPDGTQAKKQLCPQCDIEGSLVYKEGCLICQDCGYSKCG